METGSRLRRTHWQKQMEAGIDGIPSNDFSFYDQMLDTAVLLNAVPQRYRDLGIFFIGYLFRDGSRLSGAGWGCQGSSHEKMV